MAPVEIGIANGRIAIYFDEESARQELELYENEYGPRDGATVELREAIERAYPAESYD